MPIAFPPLLTNEDKIRFLYRVLELLRQEHNQKGKDFKDKIISEKEFRAYQQGEFNEKMTKIFSLLNPLKQAIGMYDIKPFENTTDSRLKLKAQGITTTKWDAVIDIINI